MEKLNPHNRMSVSRLFKAGGVMQLRMQKRNGRGVLFFLSEMEKFNAIMASPDYKFLDGYGFWNRHAYKLFIHELTVPESDGMVLVALQEKIYGH